MRIVVQIVLLAAITLPTDVIQAQETEFPEAAKPCLTCHGKDGRGRAPGFPNLCGQKSIYTMQQLTMFREKKRIDEVMNITAADLTDGDIRAIAEYYEAQPPCK